MNSSRTTYHHGQLVQALIDATLDLIEEGGVESVSVREAAKRAGVSSGAPFRHFPNRTALLTAVAEEATRRFRLEIDKALAATPEDDPLARFQALGTAYFAWAQRFPTHFAIVSNRRLIDYEGSSYLKETNGEIVAMMSGFLEEARARGQIRPVDQARLQVVGRAFVYGLARMIADGHMAQWQVGTDLDTDVAAELKLFVDLLRV